jgi:hypothetical protein
LNRARRRAAHGERGVEHQLEAFEEGVAGICGEIGVQTTPPPRRNRHRFIPKLGFDAYADMHRLVATDRPLVFDVSAIDNRAIHLIFMEITFSRTYKGLPPLSSLIFRKALPVARQKPSPHQPSCLLTRKYDLSGTSGR